MFVQAYVQADFFGKFIFLCLFVLSCCCWGFLIHKLLLMRHIQRGAKQFQNLVETYREKILNIKVNLRNPFGSLYQSLKEKTIQMLDKNHYFSSEGKEHYNYLSSTDMDSLTIHIHRVVARQREKIENNLFILSTTVTLAPFLGLLGTVWGILITFSELRSGHLASSNSVVLGGLSTALTTTVLGLLIAIPALIAYNYLKNLSRRFAMEMHDFSHFLLSVVELQYRKVDLS